MNFDDVEDDVSPGGVFYRTPKKGVLKIFTTSIHPILISFPSREIAISCRETVLKMKMEGSTYLTISDNSLGGNAEITVILSAIQYMVVE